jgi:hypothetical protein
MLDMDDAGIDSGRQFCFLLHSATARLDPHPIAVDDAVARCSLCVDLGEWIVVRLAQIGDLAMFRIEEERNSPAFLHVASIAARGNATVGPKSFCEAEPLSKRFTPRAAAFDLLQAPLRLCRALVDMRRDATFFECVAKLHAEKTRRRVARDIGVIFVH